MDMGNSSGDDELVDVQEDDILIEVEKLLAETKQVKEEQEKNLLQMELLEMKNETLTKEKEKLELEMKGQNIDFVDKLGTVGHSASPQHGRGTSVATNSSNRTSNQ